MAPLSALAAALGLALLGATSAVPRPAPAARVPAPPRADGEESPASVPALSRYLRARVALARGDLAEAAREIDLAIGFDPGSAALRAAAADLFLELGDARRATGEARRAIDLGRASSRAAELRGHAVLGRVAASESRWSAAAAELRAAARLDEMVSAREGGPGLAPQDRFVLGVALESLRSWDEAATAFSRVGGDDESLAALASLRQAYSLTRGRRHDEALAALDRARRAGDVRFATMRAFVLGRAGRSGEAEAGLRAEMAAHGEGDRAGAALGELAESLGAVLVEAGRPADAVVEVERALSLRPGDRALVIALATALERAGDSDAAASRVRALLDDDPDDVEALNFVGYLLADRGVRLDEAERLLTRAAELAPGEGAVLDSLGWLWFRKGDPARAIRLLERADALAGPDATILDHLGDAYRAARRNPDAARAWRRALAELDADPPSAAGEAERARRQRAALAAKLRGIAPARAVR